MLSPELATHSCAHTITPVRSRSAMVNPAPHPPKPVTASASHSVTLRTIRPSTQHKSTHLLRCPCPHVPCLHCSPTTPPHRNPIVAWTHRMLAQNNACLMPLGCKKWPWALTSSSLKSSVMENDLLPRLLPATVTHSTDAGSAVSPVPLAQPSIMRRLSTPSSMLVMIL